LAVAITAVAARVLPFCSFGASSVHAAPPNSWPAAGRTVRFLYSCSANAWMLPALRPVSYMFSGFGHILLAATVFLSG
jgi:hypothetical protein